MNSMLSGVFDRGLVGWVARRVRWGHMVPVFGALLLSNCASLSKMPLTQGSQSWKGQNKSLIVGRVSIRNEHKPSQQPDLLCVLVDDQGDLRSYTKPTQTREGHAAGNEYMISMDVSAGRPTIQAVRFQRMVPFVMMALAELPIKQSVEVPPGAVVYIGHITAVIKPKEGTGRPAAGPPIPLIDQALAGFSTGTFYVEIKDEFEKDMKDLKAMHPFLRDMKFVKSILPAWSPQ